MKKLSIFFASMVAVLGFTSCEEDTDPVYHAPTTFELNTPALQDQYFELAPGGTFEIVAKAQPDYGYSAITNYGCIVSLTPDFTDVRELTAATQSKMTFKQEDLALAICELKGYDSEDNYVDEDPIPVYFKGFAYLTSEGEELEGSRIVSSNYVTLNRVKYYFAVPTAGYIYLVGSPSGWNEPKAANADLYADWRLYEDDTNIGSKIYKGVFDIPAGEVYMRFYTELAGWGDDGVLPSVGPHATDGENEDIDAALAAGSYAGTCVPGKGSWFFNWGGGELTIVVNMANSADMTVQFLAGAQQVVDPRYVYMVGNNGGWAEPVAGTYEDWKLVDNSESGVYVGTFDLTDLPAANLYCRFYETLNGWGAAQWASTTDADFVCALGEVVATKSGEGCFVVENAQGTTVKVTLDTNNNTVVFE